MRSGRIVGIFTSAGVLAVTVLLASLAHAEGSTSKPAAGAAAAGEKKPAAAAPAKVATKTLEDITIEGEVKLPEVLFITSRDVERPLDWLEGYLHAEEGAVARADEMPVRLHVVPLSPSDSTAVGAQVGAEILFTSPATESAR